ncbi:pheromone-processing carboxypeptidase KEX1-like [Cynara cardunculus var. scolymus]|uniref:pheromone-processing carboxypeptidase KEX1-like n=1 Tax=Cynara cardunculus var. scolymus TaxID=59895 RepID=UPI000D6293CE|nr:pheromone-processing carboxypeptidase KEX1-like [Cynara cardunculus var. scolymus]
MADLEQRMDIAAKSLDNLTSCFADNKEKEKDLAAAVHTTPADADAQVERAEANEADAITFHEVEVVAEDEEIDDAVRADAQDEDLPITSAVDVGDKEGEDEDDDDDDEADDPLSFPDAKKDLGDDDDDDNDFTIQYHTKPATALKGVSFRESSSQGEKEKEKEKETSLKNQNTSSKDKGVAEKGNLKVLFNPINP